MLNDPGALVVFVTVPDEPCAVKLSESLLQQRLAACIHVLPAGTSRYRWQGKIESSVEYTLLIKTTSGRFAELEAAIRRLHPYEVPEIVGVPMVAVAPSYLKWIRDETT